MITLGKEIISLRERFGAPWSQFAFMLRYSGWSILLHSLTSTVIVCDEETTNRVLAGQIAKQDMRHLKIGRLVVKDANDDKCLLDDLSAKVRRHLGKSGIRTLLLIVTDRCNLDCVYCFEKLSKFSKSRSMSLFKMKEAVDYFLSLNKKDGGIYFYGGEPLTEWENVRQCIEYIRTQYRYRKVNIQITTNGTIHPRGIIQFCKEHNVGIGISIDGPREVTNANRSSQSHSLDVFQRSSKFLHDCREAGLKHAALCTISYESAKHLEKVVDFFITEGVVNVVINFSIKRAGESIQEDLPFWDDLGSRMAVQGQKLIDHGIAEPRTIRYLSGIANNRFTIADCEAGYGGQIIVDPGGFIGPCQAFLNNPKFWVPMNPAIDIPTHPLWLNFSQRTTLNIASCKSCPFIRICSGGCRYDRSDFGKPNPNFCQYVRSFLYHALSNLEERR